MIIWSVLLVTVSVLALFLHRRGPGVVSSALLAALTVAVLLQLLTRIRLGHIDPFWPVAAVWSFAVCSVVAAGVLYLTRWFQRRNHDR
jgi:peptidoglycan biosynthesis protein MviN/MurJ (putative lipid II flippase)